MTQFLSGRRAFRRHLFRFDLTNTPFCTFRGDEEDTSKHAVFWCQKWTRKREECRRVAGTLAVDNIVQKMIREERCWEVVQAMIRKILKGKMREDWITDSWKGLKQYHLGKFVGLMGEVHEVLVDEPTLRGRGEEKWVPHTGSSTKLHSPMVHIEYTPEEKKATK